MEDQLLRMRMEVNKKFSKGESQKSCLSRRRKRVGITLNFIKMIEIKDLNTVEGGPGFRVP